VSRAIDGHVSYGWHVFRFTENVVIVTCEAQRISSMRKNDLQAYFEISRRINISRPVSLEFNITCNISRDAHLEVYLIAGGPHAVEILVEPFQARFILYHEIADGPEHFQNRHGAKARYLIRNKR